MGQYIGVVSDASRVLLSAIVVAVVAVTMAARRVLREPEDAPARLVGQLHLSQWAALWLTASGALSIGLAISSQFTPGASLEVGLGLVWIFIAGLTLRAPLPHGLHLQAVACGVHAMVAFAHRPGWLSPALAPDWLWVGHALLDLYVATICSLCARAR